MVLAGDSKAVVNFVSFDISSNLTHRRNRSFFLQLPLIGLAVINIYFALDHSGTKSGNLTKKLKRVDFGGAISLIIAVSTLLLGLDHGSNHSWKARKTIWYLITSTLSFQTFLIIEFLLASDPSTPSSILTNRLLLAPLLCNLLAYSAQVSLTYYLPLYWQAALGLSATQSALRLLPGIGAGVLGSMISGWVS